MRYGSRKVGVSQSGSGESPRVGFFLWKKSCRMILEIFMKR